jgi:C4-dicarboxylate transporter DctM subunit
VTVALALLPAGLLLLGAPIVLVFLAASAAAIAFVLPVPGIVVQQTLFGTLSTYALLAVPFFLFAGELMRRSGIADRLVEVVEAAVGRIPGSGGLTVLGSGTVLGAISGSSPATVAVIGKSLYPSLLRARWRPRTAAGLIASSASIAIVIPPSIAMILYGAAAQQSIAKLFVAGILPGLFIAGLMSVAVVAMAIHGGAVDRLAFDARRLGRAAIRAIGPLGMPVFVLGGVGLGWFSPTEAGGFACVYAIVLGTLVLRSLAWPDVLDAAAEAAVLSAQVLVIVAAAGLYAYLLTTLQVPQAITAWVTDLALPAWGLLLAINGLLLGIGCLLDPTSAILVLTPLLVPMVTALGVDPIHFGIVMTVNLSIGMFTPPFGLNVFVAQSVLDLPLKQIFAGVLPFALIQIAALAVITYWPALSLALPGLM